MENPQLYMAIEALYDELDRSGGLSGENTVLAYRMYQVRLEAAKSSDFPDVEETVKFWQEKIDKLN